MLERTLTDIWQSQLVLAHPIPAIEPEWDEVEPLELIQWNQHSII